MYLEWLSQEEAAPHLEIHRLIAVADVRLELVRVEPGLRETAAEAGAQAFAQKQWQPLGGKGACKATFWMFPHRKSLTAERPVIKRLLALATV